ncbi:MAG: DHH family phosphoesterase [Oscillospiraceae bacterium]
MKLKTSYLIALTVAAALAAALASAWILYDNPDTSRYGALLFGISAGLAVLLAAEFFAARLLVLRYIRRVSADITDTERDSLRNFPAPAAIIDTDTRIVWSNKLFDEDISPRRSAFGKKIDDLFALDLRKTLSPAGEIADINSRYYRVKSVVPQENSGLTMLFFNDITDFVELEFEYRQTYPSVLLVAIDNYEDLMQNVRESEKAHALVAIETLMESFIDPTSGVIRRVSNSLFLCVVEERHLSKMISSRFPVLDKARAIAVGERMTVTLSIGVGRGAKNLAESELFAKQALDMCLGRGGDQAAVKTENGFEFFGGVSKGVEKHTKVKTRIIATALKELVSAHETVFIMGHRMGDLDSIGAATGLCAVFRRMGKASFVVVDPEKNMANQLITYITSHENMNYFIAPQEALAFSDPNPLLIIADTHNPDIIESPELYKKTSKVVVIDHHRRMVSCIDNSVIFYHEPLASSACEMVAELIQYFGETGKIQAPHAEALLAGIMLDTKNFVMRTGVRTFEAAAFLRKQGADTIRVKAMFNSSAEIYQEKSRLIASAEIYRGCAVAVSDNPDPSVRLAAPQAADELLGITEVNASFVLYDDGQQINVSARSLGKFNVQVIMEAIGGGGHQTMAGGQLTGSLADAKNLVLDAIDAYMEKSGLE